MKEISIEELIALSGKKSDREDSIDSDNAIYVNTSNHDKSVKRDKGVETVLYETETANNIIVEVDCKTGKVIGFEVF